ncbi:M81 family metallopeptidase [Sphingobacterium sp. SYP-B4668]|uniref:M81 family metallopeptidase n=1 Tax=Sphingobacterium sp. SYP-B4668 TaxID=2996035 RepID=UPI0022DDEE0C|nr:M81 family metallopeptidase [Sphingobacterium sp. SYP-B4668]
MAKRIAIVGIYHESNTFSKRSTSWEDFANGHLFYNEHIREEYATAFHEIGGFMEGMQGADIELIPVFFAEATPGGTIGQQTYERLRGSLMSALQRVPSVDAIYAVAHGAAVSEQIRDVDGDWLKAIRAWAGPQMPIVASLDPHANVSMDMVGATDVLVAYATNPHLDQRDTGLRVADILKRMLFDGLQLKQELLQIPASLSIEQQETAVEPCLSLYREVSDLLCDSEEIVSHSVILGFPYADVYEMGTSLILITQLHTDTFGLKLRLRALFEHYYDRFIGARLDIAEILTNHGQYPKPVLLLDMGDNVGGGALGNSSYLLDALEARGLTKACICIADPELVEYTKMFKQDEEFDLDLGKLNEHSRSQPYRVHCVERKAGFFMEEAPRHGGQVRYDMGPVVLLKTVIGNFILLTTLRVPPFSSKQLRVCDLALDELNWIVAKGVNAPIAAYRDICPIYFKVHTPGECNADATQFEYVFRRRPMIPFEKINKYE